MLERVAHVGGHFPTLLLVVFAASLADVRRSPAPAPSDEPMVCPVERPPTPARVEPAAPPTASWPRLTRNGFAGMTADDMASIGAVLDAFPGAVLMPRWSARRLELDPPVYDLLPWLAQLLDVHFVQPQHYAAIEVTDGRATSVSVTRPGVVTEHGLQVGEPLAGVLRVRAPRRCEVNGYFSDSSQTFARFVHCRIGELSYYGSVPQYLFAEDLLPTPAQPIPSGGRALDRWIADMGMVIDSIVWEPARR